MSVTAIHEHIAKYHAHHRVLRDHHRHVAHKVAAERAAAGAAVPTMTHHLPPDTAAGVDPSRPPQGS